MTWTGFLASPALPVLSTTALLLVFLPLLALVVGGLAADGPVVAGPGEDEPPPDPPPASGETGWAFVVVAFGEDAVDATMLMFAVCCLFLEGEGDDDDAVK